MTKFAFYNKQVCLRSDVEQKNMQKYIGFFQNFFRKNTDERSLMEKMRDQYRMVIMNEETFEEVSSLKLSPLNVYVFFSSVLVGTAMLVVSLIVYTPLKRYIPGYGDFSREKEVASLTAKVSALEKEMDMHRRYNDNFRKILVGETETFTREAAEKQNVPASAVDSLSAESVDRIPEEEDLRRAVDQGTFTREPAQTVVLTSGSPKSIPLEQILFMPPVSGEVTAAFDLQKDHFGIDIAAAQNTAVKAAADGMVISSGYTVETGYSIAIQHPNNTVTFYKHNSVLLKKEGSPVRTGEAIAIVGNTGERSSGPHLHFELWFQGRPVNPSDFIVFN